MAIAARVIGSPNPPRCRIRLPASDLTALRHLTRTAADPATRQRAVILLLLHAGVGWAAVTAALGCSSATVARWSTRYRRGGVGVLTYRPMRATLLAAWVRVITFWVLNRSPRAFGLARSRWTCRAVAVVAGERLGVPVGRETVRRCLTAAGLVWRRPRPILRRTDPLRSDKLRRLRRLLRNLPADETAVFMDEVEVHLNPKVGGEWMRRGEQATVETPGDNRKQVIAGSLHWRTGRLIDTWGGEREGRTAGLFCRHLDDLRRVFRQYTVIHVICDNAGTHKPETSRAVRAYLAEWGHRIVLHYLPVYAPECNPVEQVWWRLHEAVTRNHRCRSLEELIDLTIDWLHGTRYFRVQRSLYPNPLPQPLSTGRGGI